MIEGSGWVQYKKGLIKNIGDKVLGIKVDPGESLRSIWGYIPLSAGPGLYYSVLLIKQGGHISYIGHNALTLEFGLLANQNLSM